MRLFSLITSACLLSVLLPISAQAQEASAQADNSNSVRKRIEISRTDLAPNLDGILDDEIWKTATLISDFHQYSPIDQGTPSEKSEFYITYSEDYFYIAARLYDDAPEEISARQLIQGSSLGFDDSFKFLLDTFNNGRTGYKFEVNPNGIRREGLYEGTRFTNDDWSGIWLVEARIDDLGWTAEVAIPFNTINFDPESDEWGFSISRTIARKQEDIAWSSFNRNVDPSTAGIIYGLHDLEQGLGLDIIPSLSMSSSEDYKTGETDSSIEPSVDIFYKFTPNLTGALTINTDFSATEVDNRQVNLSRFSLFFPEKRDFFLQDADIFGFGGLSGGFGGGPPGGGGGFPGGSNGIPFYSRRIGLSPDGSPVGIDAGVKLTGRVGAWNVGGLVTQQEEFQYFDPNTSQYEQVDSQALFVGRASANILDESSVGAIYTEGDPSNSNVDNSLMGVDFHYQKTRFSESHSLSSDMWYQESSTEGVDGDEKAYGINARFDTQGNGFGGTLGYSYFGDDYNPALGFANRVGVETFDAFGSGRYYLNDHPLIRNLFSVMGFNRTLILETGEIQSESLFWDMININTHRGDRLGLMLNRSREGLTTDFEIRPGIIIPAGDYTFMSYGINLMGTDQRSFSPFINVRQGEYYDGDRMQVTVGAQWRPNEHLFLDFNYNYQDVELPQGDFVTRLISMKANYAFTAKWSWINLLQYDNFSSTVGLNSRLRWNPQAGEDLFLVINYNFDSEGTLSGLSSNSSEIVLKYTKTFRF